MAALEWLIPDDDGEALMQAGNFPVVAVLVAGYAVLAFPAHLSAQSYLEKPVRISPDIEEELIHYGAIIFSSAPKSEFFNRIDPNRTFTGLY